MKGFVSPAALAVARGPQRPDGPMARPWKSAFETLWNAVERRGTPGDPTPDVASREAGGGRRRPGTRDSER